MKNILIICADKNLRKDISKALTSRLNCIYVDVDEIVDLEVLNNTEIKLDESKKVLNDIEKNAIKKAKEFKNSIITISHNVFVSNDNFSLFNNSVKIYISLSKAYFIAKTNQADKYRLEQELSLFEEIDNLIKNNCDYVIEKGIKTVQQICDEINGLNMFDK